MAKRYAYCRYLSGCDHKVFVMRNRLIIPDLCECVQKEVMENRFMIKKISVVCHDDGARVASPVAYEPPVVDKSTNCSRALSRPADVGWQVGRGQLLG